MSRFYHFKIVLSGLFLLTGCTQSTLHPIDIAPQSAEAEKLLRQGEPKKAARLYQQLADNNAMFQDQFRLRAIEALIQAGDSSSAKSYADATDPANLSEDQRSQLNLYYAQIDLSFGEAEQALERLNLTDPYHLSRRDLLAYYKAQAFAYSLTGQLLKSAAARIELSRFLSPAEQQKNNEAILETLSLLPLKTLELNQNQPSHVLAGWIALARTLKAKSNFPSQSANSLNQWRRQYPKHPANIGFLDNYLQKSGSAFNKPSAIAVFLPESGPYVRAGKAIREGIMAAYYQNKSTTKPAIRFYNSYQAEIPSLYFQAIAEGAQFVIGPLGKPEIQSLASINSLQIPVLALNHVPEVNKRDLYQFGLSPLDDTEQLTDKAWFDGHQKAVALIPDSSQGRRIGQYLKFFWENNNGTLLETQTYANNQSDFSGSIKALLNIDESEFRYNQIRQILPSVQFVPRVRKDTDILFLNAYDSVARALVPQLKFYRANSIPIYATPHVFGGLPNVAQDRELNAITFCDIPWLFNESYQGELSLKALQNTWQQFPSIYLRLMAMGIDAYNVIEHLSKLDTTQYPGATGKLLLTKDNRIKRSLVCAQFQDGYPKVSGYIDSSAGSYQSIAGPQETFE